MRSKLLEWKEKMLCAYNLESRKAVVRLEDHLTEEMVKENDLHSDVGLRE